MLNRTVKVSIVSAAVLLSALSVGDRAVAGPFDFITKPLEDVNKTIEGANDTQKKAKSTSENLRGVLGVSDSNKGTSMESIKMEPSTGMEGNGSSKKTSANSQPDNDLFSIYGDWYKSLSPSGKKAVTWLTSKYAEDSSLNFKAFKSSDVYKKMNAQDKQKADAIFFKFNEVTKVAAPQKDKFLSFAFCVNSGSNNCK
jgi:hypothetical protein